MANFGTISALMVVLAVSCIADDHGEDVVQYTTETFAEEVQKNPHFVMFYAPWCGHCKRLAPTFNQLAQKHNGNGQVTIAKVDCTEQQSLCSQHGVTGYPTLKFFQGADEPVKYSGSRTIEALDKFISDKFGVAPEEEVEAAEAPSGDVMITDGLMTLTEATFTKGISQGHTLVKFYAPWCGHCKRLIPAWEGLAKEYKDSEGINIAKVDCTEHGSVCNTHEVRGYPTLIYFKDGEKVENYQGSREQAELSNYIFGKANIQKTDDAKPEAVEDAPADIQDGVYVLGVGNFNSVIEKGISFVKFYAPWCGHCKRLAPTWDDLAKEYTVDKGITDVKIAKVDCTDQESVCSDHGVRGYPTLILFKDGKKDEEYSGPRDLTALTNYIKRKRGVADDSPPEAAGEEAVDGLSVLTADNFESTLKDSFALVKFYAPWCGHCKALAPTWDSLAAEYKGHDNVIIGKVDCTVYRELCGQHEVRGYPTIYYFKNGERIEKYQSSRNLESLIAYVDKQLLTVTDEEREDLKKADVSPPPPLDGSVLHLNDATFKDTISTGYTFVKFFAPWCGHCKALVPTWTELSDTFIKSDNIKIAKVDCTLHEKLCEEHGIEAFPSLVLYKNGVKLLEHEGERDLVTLRKIILDKIPHDEL